MTEGQSKQPGTGSVPTTDAASWIAPEDEYRPDLVTPRTSDFAAGLLQDPRTTALPIIDEETISRRVAEAEAAEPAEDEDAVVTAAQQLEENLIGGKRVLTRKEVAQLANVSSLSARRFWRSLGMPMVPEGQAAFTVADVDALDEIAKIVDADVVDDETVLSLTRAIGQTTDRLVVWQMETLVEYLSDVKGLTDLEARARALEVFEHLIDPLEEVMVYAWRRNLANALGRLNVDVTSGLNMATSHPWDKDSALPLARAIGFVDLVSYTRLSQQLEPRQLAAMVKRFQNLAYTVVATGGGRVIKTVGDEVFFAADTPQAGAEIALALRDRVKSDLALPRARVGVSWGKVISRLGDIFGSTVNLAARLTAVANPGTVLTDWETAQILSRAGEYEFAHRRTINLQGLGELSVVEMSRGTAEPFEIDLIE